MERMIGASPRVGGLRGSTTWGGRPKYEKGSRGNMSSLGEKSPPVGVAGYSTKRIPATPVKP